MANKDWIPARCRTASALDRLRNGPINCVVLDWPASGEALIRRAREAGLAVVADAGKDAAAVTSANAAGVDAVIGPPAASGVIPAAPIGGLPRSAASPVIVVRDCVWPGVRAGANGEADAGPTGAPWVDANGWIARLARTLTPGKSVWLDFAPPQGKVAATDQWTLAACEAAAYGARWILPAEALEPPVWEAVSGTLAFFKAHPGWPADVVSPLALLSDFAGPHEFLSHEFLNLSARRQLPVRILERGRAAAEPWDGISTFVYADAAPPDPRLFARLTDAVKAGGMLIAPSQFPPLASATPGGEAPIPGYRMFAAGKGRVAVPQTPWDDPYLMVADVQNLMSRRELPVRLWNAGSIVPLPAGTGGRLSMVHLVKYSSRPGNPVTLGVGERRRSAMFYSPSAKPVRLEARAARKGVEFHLPPFAVYAAVVLEGIS